MREIPIDFDRLVTDVQTYIDESGEKITNVSAAALGDGSYLARIMRRQKNPTLTTIERIYRYMQSNPPDRVAAARRKRRRAA